MNKTKRKTKKENGLKQKGQKKVARPSFSINFGKILFVLVCVFGIALPVYHVLWYSLTRGWTAPIAFENFRNTLFFASIFFALLLNAFLWFLSQHIQNNLKLSLEKLSKIKAEYFETEELMEKWKTLQITSLIFFLIEIVFWSTTLLFAFSVVRIIRPLF